MTKQELRTATPIVGQTGTMLVGTDQYAIEVIEVINARKVIARNMKAINTKQWPEQEWDLFADENARTFECTRTKRAWQRKGENCPILFTFTEHYLDPEF